jgi:hypothetical protein
MNVDAKTGVISAKIELNRTEVEDLVTYVSNRNLTTDTRCRVLSDKDQSAWNRGERLLLKVVENLNSIPW